VKPNVSRKYRSESHARMVRETVEVVADAFRFGSVCGRRGSCTSTQSIEITLKTVLEVHDVITRRAEFRGKSAMEIRDAAPDSTIPTTRRSTA